MVAGGGGGATQYGNGGNAGFGGNGGPTSPTTAYSAVGTKGQDGTYSGDWAGGAAGVIVSCPTNRLGQGASSTQGNNALMGFSGGGGGYCGGGVGSDNGGGWGAPGGGGSSYSSSTYVPTAPLHNGGAQCGDGASIIRASGFDSAQDGNCAGRDPNVPGTPTASALSGRVNLTWTEATSPINDFVINYGLGAAGTVNVLYDDGYSSNLSTTVSGLSNGQGYRFAVQAINDYGISPFSSPSTLVLISLL